MEQKFIGQKGNQRLILIFAGWAMDATPFTTLHKNGYNILLLYNYTGYTDDGPENDAIASIAREYNETVVFAWSFGVRIATAFLKKYGDTLKVTMRVAVNGTPTHIDDSCGIPAHIFRLTLQGMSEPALRKFHRRMFASDESYNAFAEVAPARGIESAIAELHTFATLPPADGRGLWDTAVISTADRIFPYNNQLAGWSDTDRMTMHDAPHYPDIQSLIDRFVVEKQRVAQKFAQASDTYLSNASVQTQVADTLWTLGKKRLGSQDSFPRRVLEIGVGCGTLTALYAHEISYSSLTLWDIADVKRTGAIPPDAEIKCCDAETAISDLGPESIDLVMSASTLQWFHSPTRFIAEMTKALAPGGTAMLALYGTGTFHEVEQATGRSLHYPSLTQLTEAAKTAGLTIVEAQEDNCTIQFADVHQLALHLKQTGVNAVGGEYGRRESAMKLMRNYPLLNDGTAPLTYRPIYIILKKQLYT